MNWFRLYTETTRDHKLRRLPVAQRWLWIAVLSLARQSCIPGHLLLAPNVPVTTEDLADEAAVSIEEVESGIVSFTAKEMLHLDHGVYVVSHWHDRQFESDDSTRRVNEWRARQDITDEVDVTLQQRYINSGGATLPETDTESETDPELDIHARLPVDDCSDIAAELEAEMNKRLAMGPAYAKSAAKDYAAEFEQFWQEYPRHKEKQVAFRQWKVRLKEGVKPEAMIVAAGNYRQYCESQDVEPKHIKHGATFLGRDRPFEDFINGFPNERNYQPKGNGRANRTPVALIQTHVDPSAPRCADCGTPLRELILSDDLRIGWCYHCRDDPSERDDWPAVREQLIQAHAPP